MLIFTLFSLAKSYEVSEDGLTYTLQLQEGVLFHSGNPMTSEDVKYSLERIKDSGARASQVEKISSIETPDENTVVIQLESEYSLRIVQDHGFLIDGINDHVNFTVSQSGRPY